MHPKLIEALKELRRARIELQLLIRRERRKARGK